MNKRRLSVRAISLTGALALAACSSESPSSDASPAANPDQAAVQFKDASLIVEINATDGDAGLQIQSTIPLSHAFPEGPTILSPEEESTVAPGELVVRWEPVTEPAEIEIAGYQVVVVREDPLRTLEADLLPTATEMSVPAEFLEAGAEYKVEVVAVEASGNQTLSEITFSTA